MGIYKFRKLKELYKPYNTMYRNKVTTCIGKDISYLLLITLFPDLRYKDEYRSVKVLLTSYYNLTVIVEDTNNGWYSETASAVNKRLKTMFLEKKECVEW